MARAGFEGIGARISSWTSAEIDFPTFRGQVTAGWFGEIYFSFALSLLFAFLGRRFPILTGGFPIGYAWATWIRGYYSYDFKDGVHNYVSSFTQYSDLQRSAAEAFLHGRLVVVWSVLCIFAIAVSLALSIYGIKKKKARA